MAQIVSNTDQLRSRIDRGETNERIGFPDPATVPLGTDAEAGGAPPKPSEVALDAALSTSSAPRRRSLPNSGIAIYVAIAVLFAILLISIIATTGG